MRVTMAKKLCACCKSEIDTVKDGFVRCLDNFLQAKYFDSEENNLFCSKECACESMMIEHIFEFEENFEFETEQLGNEIIS